MANLTEAAARRVQAPELSYNGFFNVAAGVEIFAGALIQVDGTTGVAENLNGADADDGIFYGVAAYGHDNSGGAAATTSYPLEVETGQIEELTLTGATAADVGKAVFGADGGRTVSLTDDATTKRVGVITGININKADTVYVKILQQNL